MRTQASNGHIFLRTPPSYLRNPRIPSRHYQQKRSISPLLPLSLHSWLLKHLCSRSDVYKQFDHILISAAGTIGRTVRYNGEKAYFQDSNIVWITNDESIVLNDYLYYLYQLQPWKVSAGGTIARLYNDNISSAEVDVPSIPEQKRIVDVLRYFDDLCNNLSEGIPAEIEARQKQYEYYRDRLLSFKEK